MDKNADRLYELLPAVYRKRDAEQGYPLRALLQVISEQVNLIEGDIDQLYENWFIETCQDWAVAYIGDLVGYRPVHEAGEPGEITTTLGRLRNKILIPRREVAKTVRYRRRKGTLALLEQLSKDVAGWPARAVEFYNLLSFCQSINHINLGLGKTTDLRLGDALDRLDGPFDELSHTVDVRRVSSHHSQGRYNIPNIGVYVWPIKSFSVTRALAFCHEKNHQRPFCFTFSILGNDCALFNRPKPETEPTHIAEELNLPVPIRRRDFAARKADYYGEGRSLQIWLGDTGHPISIDQIVAADLSHWHYRPHKGHVAVDPVLGRIAFSPRQILEGDIIVSYHYGFSADIGGGEYERVLSQPEGSAFYYVGTGEEHKGINDALAQWRNESPRPKDAVIEITDSGVYEPEVDGKSKKINIELDEGESLQIRAANGARPVIRLMDLHVSRQDYLTSTASEVGTANEDSTSKKGRRLTLDGLMITNHGVRIMGDVNRVTIRHCTLVPGLAPLELVNLNGKVKIEHSILGSIIVNQDEVRADPLPIYISDSILDGVGPERVVFSAPTDLHAHAALTILRSTVLGKVLAHTIELAENCIFDDLVRVVRSQRGCMRFCYITKECAPGGHRVEEIEHGGEDCDHPHSRTPRRFCCQPDMAMDAAEKELREDQPSLETEPGEDEINAVRRIARNSVRPRFCSKLYGRPDYCRLEGSCPEEIVRGAEDESEMGVFQDLFQPQREANLRARLDEYTVAGMDAGIIYADYKIGGEHERRLFKGHV
jgi:hypothetical protein